MSSKTLSPISFMYGFPWDVNKEMSSLWAISERNGLKYAIHTIVCAFSTSFCVRTVIQQFTPTDMCLCVMSWVTLNGYICNRTGVYCH